MNLCRSENLEGLGWSFIVKSLVVINHISIVVRNRSVRVKGFGRAQYTGR